MVTDNDAQRDGVVEEKFRPDQNRSLSDAVLEAIDQFKDEDIIQSDFILYDDIDPDAINNLFRDDARPGTMLYFDMDDVQVELWGNSGVDIRVREQ